MRSSFTVFLLLLSLLLSEQAQGIRLGKGYMSNIGVQHKSIHVEDIALSKLTKNNDVEIVAQEANNINLCKDGDCSGNSRKLVSVTLPSTTTTTTSKTVEKNIGKINKADYPNSNGYQKSTISRSQVHGEEEEEKYSSVNSMRTFDEHPAPSYEHYSDVVDLAEMDYSPARRKTPIHN